jgi:hypothetical protein
MDEAAVKSIRAVARKLRAKDTGEGEFYQLPIRNWPLFCSWVKSGKVHEIRPGVWELVESNG